MTRINLVDPSELMDQHLFAEFREIKMISPALLRSLKANLVNGDYRLAVKKVKAKIPKDFTLNSGHVMFFYDKGLYLTQRYKQICAELVARGYQFDKTKSIDPHGLFVGVFNKDYVPTPEALAIVRDRINYRISQKPNWYRKTQPL